MPKSKLSGLTPWEVYNDVICEWNKIAKQLKRIGCLAWAVSPVRKRNKSKKKENVKEGILLGYGENSKGYIFQDINTGEISTEVHVYFDENEMPLLATKNEWLSNEDEVKKGGYSSLSHKLAMNDTEPYKITKKSNKKVLEDDNEEATIDAWEVIKLDGCRNNNGNYEWKTIWKSGETTWEPMDSFKQTRSLMDVAEEQKQKYEENKQEKQNEEKQKFAKKVKFELEEKDNTKNMGAKPILKKSRLRSGILRNKVERATIKE